MPGTSSTISSNPQALDFGASDPETFQVCSFLVNVLSEMYDQWKEREKKPPGEFDWKKTRPLPGDPDLFQRERLLLQPPHLEHLRVQAEKAGKADHGALRILRQVGPGR